MLNVFTKNKRASSGMSLVELLVVMAILGVVIMAVMSLYIPTVQSTSTQTRLTDMQSNLRFAMERMTQDLLTAGFLTGRELPVIFEASATPTTAENPDSTDFTIQSRVVGSGFARVASAASEVLTLSQAEMVSAFPVGAKVRLFEPISATEINEASVPIPANRVYTVTDVNEGAKTVTLDTAVAGVEGETVVVRVRNATQPTIQKIRYRLVDTDGDGTNDTLARTINGDTQLMARNLSDVSFSYELTSEGRVRKVDVILTGKTEALVNNAIAGEKTRELKTSVTLRTTF